MQTMNFITAYVKERLPPEEAGKEDRSYTQFTFLQRGEYLFLFWETGCRITESYYPTYAYSPTTIRDVIYNYSDPTLLDFLNKVTEECTISINTSTTSSGTSPSSEATAHS